MVPTLDCAFIGIRLNQYLPNQALTMDRLTQGDRIKITDMPGRWRITQCDPPWYWVEGLDYDAQVLASLSGDGIVGFRRRDIIPDTTDHERLF